MVVENLEETWANPLYVPIGNPFQLTMEPASGGWEYGDTVSYGLTQPVGFSVNDISWRCLTLHCVP